MFCYLAHIYSRCISIYSIIDCHLARLYTVIRGYYVQGLKQSSRDFRVGRCELALSTESISLPHPHIVKQHTKMSRRNLLICFDAFGTLFAPKRPIAQQYGEVARSLGLGGFTDEQLQDSYVNSIDRSVDE